MMTNNPPHHFISRLKAIALLCFRFLLHLYNEFQQTGSRYRAAALVYATLLTLVPLLVVTFSILSEIKMPAIQMMGVEIQQFIFEHFVMDSAQSLLVYLQKVVHHVNRLSWINFITLVLMCVLMIHNMSCAFNAIWHVQRRRPLWLSFVIYLLILLLAPPFMVATLTAGVFLVTRFYTSHFLAHATLKHLFWIGLPYVATFVVFTLFNSVLPERHIPLRAASIGGLVSSVLFELAKMGLTFYLHTVPTYRLLYGALVAIPVFLIWLYLSWIIILLGAIIARISVTGLSQSS